MFAIDDTNSGQAGCPCLGDQPLIGADANGFYVSVNAFSLTSFTFEGMSIYATSKAGLESGMPGPVVHLMPASIQPNNPPVSVQPATSPAGVFQTASGGTEYLMSSNDFSPGMQNHILAWALSGTSSLLTATPALSLTGVLLSSESYGRPMPVPQEAGPIPLGASAHATFPSPLDGGDQRMNQVVYASGKLWAGLNTTVGTQTSIAWFVVRPSGGGKLVLRSHRQPGLPDSQEHRGVLPVYRGEWRRRRRHGLRPVWPEQPPILGIRDSERYPVTWPHPYRRCRGESGGRLHLLLPAGIRPDLPLGRLLGGGRHPDRHDLVCR